MWKALPLLALWVASATAEPVPLVFWHGMGEFNVTSTQYKLVTLSPLIWNKPLWDNSVGILYTEGFSIRRVW